MKHYEDFAVVSFVSSGSRLAVLWGRRPLEAPSIQ
jgi:hypothetical protein